MEVIDTTTRHFVGALSQVDTSLVTPLIAVVAIIGLGFWLVLRRRKSDRA